MASFNFEVFEAEFKQKRLLQTVADLFGALRDPQDPDERLLPVDHPLLQQLNANLRNEQQPAPNFDFELGNPITVEVAANRCAERRVAGQLAPVNLPDMLVTAGQRLFFNTNLQQPATFVEISRPEASDLPSEISVCHFLDGAKRVIDWSVSLPALKRMAIGRLYSEPMARHALHRLVSMYTPEHSHLVSDMTANEMANYLMSTETNRDKTSYRRKELFELARKPDMDLRAPLTTARRLIDMIFPANRPEMAMQRSAAWRTAIISFLPDELATPISDRLKIANEKCRPISDEELEAMAYQAEEAYRKPPTLPLKFGRNIGSLPASAMIQFNSMHISNATIPAYGIPATGYEQFYQTYPPFPPRAENNPYVGWQEANRLQQQLAAQQEANRLQQQLVAQQEADRLQLQIAAQQEANRLQQQIAAQQEATQLQRQSQPIELHSVNIQSSQNDRLSHLNNTKFSLTSSLSGKHRHDSGSRSYSAYRQQPERSRSSSLLIQKERDQSQSPGRQEGSSALASERRSRTDDYSDQRERDKSVMARRAYPKMIKGENCSLGYDPLSTKSCSKCDRPGHHEFECFAYERYSHKMCEACNKLHHFADDCKELEKFPHAGKKHDSWQSTKNW
jgi:hypothetical protein